MFLLSNSLSGTNSHTSTTRIQSTVMHIEPGYSYAVMRIRFSLDLHPLIEKPVIRHTGVVGLVEGWSASRIRNQIFSIMSSTLGLYKLSQTQHHTSTLSLSYPEPSTLPLSSPEPSTLTLSYSQPSTLPLSSPDPSTLPLSSPEPSTLPMSYPEPSKLPLSNPAILGRSRDFVKV